uniref:NADH dehydrogenase subunit 3 n=1 Tax=Silvatares holzenthali TaxID=3026466 RepID=UPI0023D8ABB2|nr:NADH dehydrogenase subunit 3 [Silvatares holzenthali]WCR50262.1 NADH dehydrogenase subunit 3 [Silvatares holzenthali]
MFILSIIFSLLLMITLILSTLALLLNKKSFLNFSKISAFECGFDPKSSPRMPFSLHFFLIAITFLIFDIEIILIIPMITIFNLCHLINWITINIIFIIILITGLYYEWSQNMLNWTS